MDEADLDSVFEAARLIMRVIPSCPRQMHQLRNSLSGRAWQNADVHSGKDIMRASAVVKTYLESCAADAIDGNVLDAFEARHLDFQLIPTICRNCSAQIDFGAAPRRGGSPRTHCSDCYASIYGKRYRGSSESHTATTASKIKRRRVVVGGSS